MGRLDYVLSDDDYVAFNTDVYRYSPGFVAASRAQRNLLCLVVPLAIVCIGALQGYPLLVLVVGGLAAAAVLWLLWPRLVTQSVRSQLKRAKASGVLSRTGAVALTWDDQRVYETFHDMGCYVDWSRIRRVAETADHLFLLRSEADPVIVPKRAGAGVAQLGAEARWRVPQA